jgi:fukutin
MKMNEQMVIETMKRINNAFTQLNVPLWITDGTLLGYHREGNFIGHDLDADFACHINNFSADIIPKLRENGIVVKHTMGNLKHGLEFALVLHPALLEGIKRVKVDVFFFYDDIKTNTVWHAAWMGYKHNNYNPREMIKYRYDKFDIERIQFKGMDLLAPSKKDIEKILTAKYGDWKTPKTKWDWAYDPLNHERTTIIEPINQIR